MSEQNTVTEGKGRCELFPALASLDDGSAVSFLPGIKELASLQQETQGQGAFSPEFPAQLRLKEETAVSGILLIRAPDLVSWIARKNTDGIARIQMGKEMLFAIAEAKIQGNVQFCAERPAAGPVQDAILIAGTPDTEPDTGSCRKATSQRILGGKLGRYKEERPLLEAHAGRQLGRIYPTVLCLK